MTQYVIGYGMGRCGTQSLAHLLNSQPDSKFSHEMDGCHWFPALCDYPGVVERLKLRAEKHAFVGDVGYSWVQQIPRIIEDFPDVKFIHTWRDKEETIESFWNVSQDRIEAIQTPTAWASDSLWFGVYPFLGFPPTKDQIASRYDIFHKIAEMIMYRFSQRVYTIKVENLSKPDSIAKLLDYVGIPSSNQVTNGVRANQGRQSSTTLDILITSEMNEKYKCSMKKGITLKASDEPTVRVDR